VREFTQAEADRHNALTRRGWALVKDRLVLQEEKPVGPPGEDDRTQLRGAIGCFEQALEINPEGWSSMWALGKIYQRLGEHATAFDWFARAHAINPEQPDVAREAGIAAMDSGRLEEALALCRSAVASRPDEPGLVCNLALAHCLAGQDAEAEQCAAEAVRRDPSDSISATVLGFVRDVASGKRPRPKRLCEVFPYG
jgi:tetratricopeptide (TPR) repeat protein